jgi:rare lipoprotein A
MVIVSLLNGCSSKKSRPSDSSESSSSPLSLPSGSSSGRYQGKDKDWGPDKEIDMSHIPDAVPRYETRTIAGNKNPYTVLGQTYTLMTDERAYTERGIASWYGFKFNGERTSNGELYDMFAMTGAHKTLPIPSYVRVTNVDNRKSVIVRINDRGPFHPGRIIDLSYAAAQRLGITQMGTGNVEVEIIVPDGDPRPPLKKRKAGLASKEAGIVPKADISATAATAVPQSQLPEGTYLQIAAFSQEAAAQKFSGNIKSSLSYPIIISAAAVPNRLYRVRVGPFKDAQSMQAAREQLQKIDISEVHVVYQ